MAFPPPPLGGIPLMPRMGDPPLLRGPPSGMMPGMPPLPSSIMPMPSFIPGQLPGMVPPMGHLPMPGLGLNTIENAFLVGQSTIPQPLLPGMLPPPPLSAPAPASVVAEATLSAPPKPATISLPDAPVTTVFVGNISDKVPDNVIRQLLMSCGTVLNWKRVQGATGKLQAFGFCEYKEPEATLRALRLLHCLRLAEKTVTVKVDTKTRKQLDEYLVAKKAALSGLPPPQKTEADEGAQNGEEVPKPEEELDEATKAEDEQVKNQILLLLKQNQATWHGNDEELNRSVAESMLTVAKQKGLVEKDGGLEDLNMDESERQLVTDEIRKFRGSYTRVSDEPPKRSKEERERTRQLLEKGRAKASEEEKEKTSSSAGDASSQTTRDSVEESAEEYKRLRKERLQRRRDDAYESRLRDWEVREKRRNREFVKEEEKVKEKAERKARDRKKAKRLMEKYDDEKDDKRYYSGGDLSRLKRERQMEIDDDVWDRRKEEEEIEAARKKAEEEAAKANEPRQPLIQPLKLQRTKTEQLQPQAAKPSAVPFPPIKVEPAPPVDKEPGVGSPVADNTPAVLRKSPPTLVGPEYVAAQIKRQKELEELAKKQAEGPEAKRKRLTVEQAFSAEPEVEQVADDKSKRKLVPLEYTEEEQQAVGRSNIPQADKKKKSIKSLIEHIPTTKDELFGYKIEWSVVDESLVKNRIKPWVNKKIVEYIGEEEPTLVDFICDKVGKHTPAESVLSDVTMVLDEEAELFVNKLWRLLIFETESKLLGLVKKESSS